MQIKWLEDFVTLAETGNFSRAAELRHVTHPAFGRRVQALEAWAGTALVDRSGSPVRLTVAGQAFLETASQMVQNLETSRLGLHNIAGLQAQTVTFATGRTLARTVLADWLVRLHPLLLESQVRVFTRSLQETVQMLERSETDFMLGYHHSALTTRLDGRQFAHTTLGSDKLVPVSRVNANGEALFRLDTINATPLLTYSNTLAMGRLVEDHLSHHPSAPILNRRIECDSADALLEYVLKGLGVAWIPWSMAQAECKLGKMVRAGDRALEIRFEIRLYRPKRKISALAEMVWQTALRR